MEKEWDKTSVPTLRRAQRAMVRSSSDSSYMSGSPGGSPCSGSTEQQPSHPEGSTHSPGPASGLPQGSPALTGSQDSHSPLRLKKSFEILVRKPTSSKPKPPPRKYFKSDSEPQKNLEDRANSSGPPGSPTCGQVRGPGLLHGIFFFLSISGSGARAGSQSLPNSREAGD